MDQKDQNIASRLAENFTLRMETFVNAFGAAFKRSMAEKEFLKALERGMNVAHNSKALDLPDMSFGKEAALSLYSTTKAGLTAKINNKRYAAAIADIGLLMYIQGMLLDDWSDVEFDDEWPAGCLERESQDNLTIKDKAINDEV